MAQIPRNGASKRATPPRPTSVRTNLTIYRLKPSAAPADGLAGALDLTDYVDVTPVAVSFSGQRDIRAWLVARHSDPDLPAWHAFLAGLTASLTQQLARTAANSAVVVLASATARYAFTFGHGHALLAPDAIERNFGLKAALALIEPASMTSVGFKEVDHTTFFSNRQSNRRVSFGNFRVDTLAAMLGGVSGFPERRDRYYTKVSGADALHINPEIRSEELPELVAWLERIHRAAQYKKIGFDWIDQIAMIQDPVEIERLKALLDADLRSSNGAITLGPPELVDYLRVSSFSVVGLRKKPLDEVDLASLQAARPTQRLSSTILEDMHVIALDDAGQTLKTWSAFDWLIWSHADSAKTYLLQAGDFYEVHRRLEKNVDTFIRDQVQDVPSSWPDWQRSDADHEDRYNETLRKYIGPTATLLDKNLLHERLAGRAALEVCDVLVADTPLKFVAVKRFGGPASVSHVVAQSLNGVISILEDHELRDELIGKLGPKHRAVAKLRALTPETAALYVLLLTKGDRRPVVDLPFFSKLTIMRAMKEAKIRGLSVFIGTRSETTIGPASPAVAKRPRGHRPSLAVSARPTPGP